MAATCPGDEPVTERDFVHRGFGGVAVAGDVARYVVLTPSREEAAALAGTWTDARRIADHYAFLVWTGRADGVPLTVCSTGTGSSSTAIAVEELAILGARTLLALGATRQPVAPGGAVIVAEGAFRADAASHGYARIGYPAAPDVEIVMAAVAAGRAAGVHLVHEVVADLEASLDAVVGTPPRPAARVLATAAAIRETGAVVVHGSPATVLVQGAIHGLRTGFLAADDTPSAQAGLRALATATLLQLAAWDRGVDGTPTGFGERMAAMPGLPHARADSRP